MTAGGLALGGSSLVFVAVMWWRSRWLLRGPLSGMFVLGSLLCVVAFVGALRAEGAAEGAATNDVLTWWSRWLGLAGVLVLAATFAGAGWQTALSPIAVAVWLALTLRLAASGKRTLAHAETAVG